MSKAIIGLRVLYGAFWLVFGVNGFLHFFPVPEPRGEAAALMQALVAAGYVMPLVYASQIVAGAMLLFGRYLGLALVILAPVVGNIVLYDIFLNHPGFIIGIIILVIYLVLLYAHRKRLMPLLKP